MIKATLIHSAQAIAEGTLVALLVVGLIAGTAFAGKGGGGGGGGHGGGGKPGGGSGGNLTLVVAVDNNGNGSPNWSDSVTYTVSTAATAYPYVSTQCTQGGSLVLSGSAGWFASYAWPQARTIPLVTDAWTGGAASCTARLYSMDGGSQTILKTITYSVGA